MAKRLAAGILLLVLLGPAEAPAGPREATLERALQAIRRSGAELQRTVLDNGMVCLIREDHSAPVVAVQIWVGTGSVHEQEYLGAGLSHYLEHMVFKGTPTRGPGEITRAIHDAGGSINAYTGQDRTVFHADLPSDQWQVGVAVLADAVMHASFPEDEWTREKAVLLREVAMGKDDPDRVLRKLLWRTAYTVHPYRFPVIGYESIIQGIEREDLTAFFRRHYVPDNMITVVVGDIDVDKVLARLKEVYAPFTPRSRAPVVLPREPRQLAPRLVRETGHYNSTRLNWAFHTVDLAHPDAPSLDVLAAVVGQGRSSRLVRKIKDEAGLVHAISAYSYTPKDPGLFLIAARCDPDKEEAVIEAVHAEIACWRDQPFTAEEIEKARRMTLAGTLASLATMNGQASDFASGEFYAADPRFSQTYLERLDQVSPAAVRRMAQTYLEERNRSLVVLAPERTPDVPEPDRPAVIRPSSVMRCDLPGTGIPLLVREDHRLPFVHICVVFGGGVRAESERNNGITRLLAEMLLRGTRSRSAAEISQTVESLGGSLTAFSGLNSFGLQARCLVGDTETFMDLIADCLTRPSFPADELARQKEVQLAGIADRLDRPFSVAEDMLRARLFPDHPYRWDPLGQTNTVTGLTRDDLLAHFRELVVNRNMAAALFGDIDQDAAIRLGERGFRRIARDHAAALHPAAPHPSLPTRAVQRLPRRQAIILAGYLGVGMDDPRRDALAVLDTILSGLSSRLATEVREKRGLAYYTGSYLRTDVDTGMFVVYAGTEDRSADEVETLMLAEAQRMAAEGPDADELARARNRMVAAHEMSLQDNGHIALLCALNELYGLGYDYLFTAPDRIRAVSSDAVREAAAAILHETRRAVVVVLPEAAQDAPAAPAPPSD